MSLRRKQAGVLPSTVELVPTVTPFHPFNAHAHGSPACRARACCDAWSTCEQCSARSLHVSQSRSVSHSSPPKSRRWLRSFPQVAVGPPVEAQPAKKLKTPHGNETSDTDLRLDDGTVVRLREVNDKHGNPAYMSLKLPPAAGQDPVAVAAAFERAIGLMAPGCWQRGRCAQLLN